MSARNLEELARAEVETRHVFFVDWFTGRADDAALDTAMACFDPAFFLVSPGGAVTHRAALRDMLAAARGRFGEDFAIAIEIEESAAVAADCALVRYVERQTRDTGMSARRSTALFRSEPKAATGAAWLFVHETWIEEADVRRGRQKRQMKERGMK